MPALCPLNLLIRGCPCSPRARKRNHTLIPSLVALMHQDKCTPSSDNAAMPPEKPEYTQSELSTYASELWGIISQEEKDAFVRCQEDVKVWHYEMHPDYVFRRERKRDGQKRSRNEDDTSKDNGGESEALAPKRARTGARASRARPQSNSRSRSPIAITSRPATSKRALKTKLSLPGDLRVASSPPLRRGPLARPRLRRLQLFHLHLPLHHCYYRLRSLFTCQLGTGLLRATQTILI